MDMLLKSLKKYEEECHDNLKDIPPYHWVVCSVWIWVSPRNSSFLFLQFLLKDLYSKLPFLVMTSLLEGIGNNSKISVCTKHKQHITVESTATNLTHLRMEVERIRYCDSWDFSFAMNGRRFRVQRKLK